MTIKKIILNYKSIILSALSISTVLLILVFSGAFQILLKTDSVKATDNFIYYIIPIIRTELLNNFFILVTFLGDEKFIAVLLIVVFFVFYIYKKRKYSIAMLITLFFSETFVYIGKNIIQRTRPVDPMLVESSFSFPSNHATVASALYGFITYLIIINTTNKFLKLTILIIGLAVILLLSFSRLYLGVHFFTDVIFGFLLGVLWLTFGIIVLNKLKK